MSLYTILAGLLVLWVLGMLLEIGGGLVHLLLVAAAIVLVYKFVSGQTSTKT